MRWHVESGLAYPAGDGSAWCRIPPTLLCPTSPQAAPLPPQLTDLRQRLAIPARWLLETGTFTPPAPEQPQNAQKSACRPARPVVQILYGRYLAAHPVDAIQCVAQTRRRHRCTSPVLDPDTPAGTWTLMPATAQRGQLALPAAVMAVYDLTHLPYAQQVRWRTQRCVVHAAGPTAAGPGPDQLGNL
jgi:hypothetical protein